jgi:hypothetical protein
MPLLRRSRSKKRYHGAAREWARRDARRRWRPPLARSIGIAAGAAVGLARPPAAGASRAYT